MRTIQFGIAEAHGGNFVRRELADELGDLLT